MKSYAEIEEMQNYYKKKYDEQDKNDERTEENRIIFGHWVDILDDMLDWNMLDYAEKIGYDFDTETEMFEITDEVKKEIIITEEQAEKELQIREKIYKEYPYGRCVNKIFLNGINADKLERDILRWVLDK